MLAPAIAALSLPLSGCVTTDNNFAAPTQAPTQAPAAAVFSGAASAPRHARNRTHASSRIQAFSRRSTRFLHGETGRHTLWQIARDQGSSVYQVKGASKLTSDIIRPGQVLQIPTRGMLPLQHPPPPQGFRRHRRVFLSAYQPQAPRPLTATDIPSPRPSATNPVIEGNQLPPSSLGRGAPAQTYETPTDFPLLPPPPEPDN